MGGTETGMGGKRHHDDWFPEVVKTLARREAIDEILALARNKSAEEILLDFANEVIQRNPENADARYVLEMYSE
jgi:carbamoylphosphate synthase large subunit